MTTERPCPLCGKSTDSTLFADARVESDRLGEFAYASRKLPEYMHLRLLLCGTCDLVYANPVPDRSELQTSYEAAAYDSQVEAEFAAKTYASQVRSFSQQLVDHVGALDIGAGDGAFCEQLLSLGFTNVVGLEPSSAPIAVAKPIVRDCLRQEMFTNGQFSAGQFSLVTCFQTIEHVPEPLEVCREAVRLLKPGGALCVVGHNRRSFSCRVLGRKSPIFDIEHLQLFSPKSMRRLLTEAGLRNIVVKPILNCYPVSYWAKLFPFPATMKQMVIRGLGITRIGKIPLIVPAGNLVAWGFR
jgi:SAM-dependent methyltransferase